MQPWLRHWTFVFVSYCVDLRGIQHKLQKCRLAAPEPTPFLPSSLKLNRWELCKYTDKDVVLYLSSLPIKPSLSFAIFTRGSRNIRLVKKVLLARLGAVLVKVPVFSCLWLFITLYFGIKFSLPGVCLWLLKTSAKSNQSLPRARLGEKHLQKSVVFSFRRSASNVFLPGFKQVLEICL